MALKNGLIRGGLVSALICFSTLSASLLSYETPKGDAIIASNISEKLKRREYQNLAEKSALETRLNDILSSDNGRTGNMLRMNDLKADLATYSGFGLLGSLFLTLFGAYRKE